MKLLTLSLTVILNNNFYLPHTFRLIHLCYLIDYIQIHNWLEVYYIFYLVLNHQWCTELKPSSDQRLDAETEIWFLLLAYCTTIINVIVAYSRPVVWWWNSISLVPTRRKGERCWISHHEQSIVDLNHKKTIRAISYHYLLIKQLLHVIMIILPLILM